MEELFKQWSEELDRQNAALVEAGEEPLTAAEFIDCRIDDAISARDTRREEHKREWWKTYRAALAGNCAFVDSEGLGLTTNEAHTESEAAANMAHGPLESKP